MTEALARQRAAAAGQKIGLAARIRRYADTRSGLAIALGSGALAAFALPPFYLVPLLLISLPILLWLLAGASGPMRAGLIGFAFGMSTISAPRSIAKPGTSGLPVIGRSPS